MIGEVINGYTVIDHLGSGAYGKTYLVKKEGGIFALKLLNTEALSAAIKFEGAKKFQEEVMPLVKAGGDYLARYMDCGAWQDERNTEHYYLVMEYITGTTFEIFLKTRREQLIADESLLKKIFSQILTGLHEMHKIEVVHRDLKPSSIFMTEDNDIKIIDFGLDGLLDETVQPVKWKLSGLPFCASPETVLKKQIDFRSDLYSFGVILYKVMTGEFPFTGENVQALSRNIVNNPFQKPSQLNGKISPEFEKIIFLLLEKKPERRQFKDAVELAKALQKIPLLCKSVNS